MPSKPLDRMTDEEVQVWKQELAEAGRHPTPLARDQEHPESQYDYDPVRGEVVERSEDGKRYIVGVRNAELVRLQEFVPIAFHPPIFGNHQS